MYAAAVGNAESLELLLDAGADVNAKNAFGATALHWGIGDREKVRLLLAKGADVDVRSKQGRTPLIIAASQDGLSETVKLLLEKGADPSIRDTFENTALLAATAGNDTATTKLLIAKGSDVNARNVASITPLMNAAAEGNVEIIKLLLARGADVNAVSSPRGGSVKHGQTALASFTPLILSVAYGDYEAVKTLLDAGAKINARDVRGMSPLMLAISSDRPEPQVVRLLLEKGADPNLKTLDGETAHDWARKFEHAPVLQALGKERAPAAALRSMESLSNRKVPTVAAGLGKSIPLLQKASVTFFKEGRCIACHAQSITAMAVSAARASGIPVDESVAAEQAKAARLHWSSLALAVAARATPG